MTDREAEQAMDAAMVLAREIGAFIGHRQVPAAVAVIAMAQLLGQSCAHLAPGDEAALLEKAFGVARQNMRLRAVAQQLEAAGLSALMPVSKA